MAGAEPQAGPPAEPEPPAELLAEGDTLINRRPPPYPYPALADSLREVLRNQTSLFPVPEIRAYAVGRDGRPVPLNELLASVEAELPAGSRAVFQLVIAWDGTLVQAVAARVRGEVPRAVAARALRSLRFAPPRDEEVEAVLPAGVPSFAWGTFTVLFRGPR